MCIRDRFYPRNLEVFFKDGHFKPKVSKLLQPIYQLNATATIEGVKYSWTMHRDKLSIAKGSAWQQMLSRHTRNVVDAKIVPWALQDATLVGAWQACFDGLAQIPRGY